MYDGISFRMAMFLCIAVSQEQFKKKIGGSFNVIRSSRLQCLVSFWDVRLSMTLNDIIDEEMPAR